MYVYLRTLRYNLEATEDEEAKNLDDTYELYKCAYEIMPGMQYVTEKDIIDVDVFKITFFWV